MQVRDEDMIQAAELDVQEAHLHLRSLSAINHIELIPQIDYLRGGQMACSR